MERPLRALIVDDSERDAELLLRELRRGGFEVASERVDTAEAMSAALAKQAWDIIFSDYSMPRFDPFSALSVMRAEGLDLPFVIVSGTVGEEAAVEAMKAGAHDYFRKDKLSPRLVPVVERELREAEGRTGRRRTERALGEKEAEYRQLVESVRAVVWRADARTFQFTFVSPEAEKVLGFPLRMWLDEPSFWSDHIHPDDRGWVVARCQDSTDEKRDHHFEYRMVAADGRTVWLHDLVRVVVEQDEARELVGVMVDVSETKRAEAVRSALYRIALSAHSAEDMDAFYAAIHRILGELMYARNFYVALYDEASDTLSFPYFVDEVDTACPPRKPGKTLTAHVLRTGRPLLVTPEVFAELVERGEVELVGADSVDWLGVPLKRGDRCFGVLAVQSYRKNVRFTQPDQDLLTFVTGHLAAAINRKHADEALEKERRLLKAVLDNIEAGVVACDAKGRLTLLNRAAREYHAQAEEPIRPAEWAERYGFYHADGTTPMRTEEVPLFRAWQGETVRHVEVVVAPKEGRARTFVVSGQPIAGAEDPKLGAVVTFHDITERKRAEERFRALVENSSDVISMLGRDGIIVYASGSLSRVLGYAVAEFVGRDAFELMHPEDAAGARKLFLECLASPGRPIPAEFRYRHKDGSWRHLEEVGVNRLDDPNVSAVVINFRDVTERIRAEEAFHRQREALYQSEKVAAMGTLLAGVAHELNNPLAVVLGQANLLQQRAGPGPLADRAETIVQAAERCARIVASFLSLARQRPPERRQVSLNTIVEEAFELLGYPLRVDDVEVRLELAADLPALWADPHQLHQVVVNLVTNAHQALRAGPPPRRITAATRVEAERVVLEVADTGPGIPPEVRPRLFEPFFTTKPPGQGTGLGLSLCLGIVETHGGTMAAGSEPGQGAVFRVELPVQAPLEKSVATGTAKEPAPLEGKAILIVDDEQAVANMLADLLSEDGHRVDTAPNGAAALEKLAARTYDVVLSDIKMPVLDGPGLYREVERRFPHLARRFVFLTGDSLSQETREFLQTAARPTAEKPVDFDDLRKAIREALAAR